MPFYRISPEKISAAVVRQVERLLLKGVLRPGDRLPAERELAERLDVSRPTLRDALADLERRGLIEVTPGGGTRVAEALGSAFAPALVELFARHEEALFDHLAFRRDLEGLAAARAAAEGTEADHRVISTALQRLEDAVQAGTLAKAAERDVELHLALVEAGHNLMMIHTMRAVLGLEVQGVFLADAGPYGVAGAGAGLVDGNRAICEAVIGRDAEAARRAVESHIDGLGVMMRDIDRTRSFEEVAELRQRQEMLRSGSGRARRRGAAGKAAAAATASGNGNGNGNGAHRTGANGKGAHAGGHVGTGHVGTGHVGNGAGHADAARGDQGRGATARAGNGASGNGAGHPTRI